MFLIHGVLRIVYIRKCLFWVIHPVLVWHPKKIIDCCTIFSHIYTYTQIYIYKYKYTHVFLYIYIHIYCFLFAFQCWFAPSKKISHWYICMWMDSLILANKMRHGKFNFSQWKMAKCSQGVDAPHASIKARHTPNLAQDRPNQAGHGPKRAVLFKPDLIFLRSGS